MLIWKYLLMSSGLGMIFAAACILGYDLGTRSLSRRASASADRDMRGLPNSHWRISLALGLLAWGPILIAVSLVLTRHGIAGM